MPAAFYRQLASYHRIPAELPSRGNAAVRGVLLDPLDGVVSFPSSRYGSLLDA